MEKPETGSRIKLWKAVKAAIAFQNRAGAIAQHRRQTRHSKGFSGPIGPMIPTEARRKPKNFEHPEPSSPKISCTGQIKRGGKAYLPKGPQPDKPGPRPEGPTSEVIEKKKKKKKESGIKKMMFGDGRESDASIDQPKPPARGAATPSLIQMRRFASSRDALAGFDWTTAAQISPAEDRDYCADDVIIPFSAPILIGRDGDGAVLDSEPRKEKNSWNKMNILNKLKFRSKIN